MLKTKNLTHLSFSYYTLYTYRLHTGLHVWVEIDCKLHFNYTIVGKHRLE